MRLGLRARPLRGADRGALGDRIGSIGGDVEKALFFAIRPADLDVRVE